MRSGGAARQNEKRRGLSILLLTAVSLQMTEYHHHRKRNRPHVRYSLGMQALGEGPRQSRRMDAAEPLDLNSQFCFGPCFAEPASPRRIHPPPFGLPPFGL